MLPAINGPRLLRTPGFLYDLFPRQYNQMAAGAQNRQAGALHTHRSFSYSSHCAKGTNGDRATLLEVNAKRSLAFCLCLPRAKPSSSFSVHPSDLKLVQRSDCATHRSVVHRTVEARSRTSRVQINVNS